MRADEQEQLGPWLAGFERVYLQAVSIEPLEVHGSGGAAADGYEPSGDLHQLRLPPVFDRLDLIGNWGHFRHHPLMLDYIPTLGYGWDDAGTILKAPTPATFNALLKQNEYCQDAGYRLAYVVEDGQTLPIGPWLTLYLAGQLPIHVGSEAYYQRTVFSTGPVAHKGMEFHFAALAHDLTVHALNYHLIPRSCIAKFAEEVQAAMPERVADWQQPGANGPLTMTLFFDNDLNRYCYDVWCRTRTPSDFARVFCEPRNFDQLMNALATRIDETLAGKGDVASGDTSDLPQLAQISFHIP